MHAFIQEEDNVCIYVSCYDWIQSRKYRGLAKGLACFLYLRIDEYGI